MPHSLQAPTSQSFSEIIDCVKEFHERFGIANAPDLNGALPADVVRLRHRLMAEETEEYLEAALNRDPVEIADALGDQLYILCGTILSHGMQHVIEDVFREIQSSNMSKLGPDGKPIYREDGKVMKGPSYFRPNIAAVLESHAS
ncbi:MAG: nucleoside triphosphate pyrophosphohydrolase family protein [Bacteroidetes bacterium]|jgi:predicted HAD superfamily Cof-like phosphohydrolase|nr:nucleoside triphosphate pyrophosphohydrolase family protein [Bacteroidota bacterium]|tara:strand:+ start:171 stop:602 length:432 start_codon:yes stop_codon:yes gene_type:complete